MPMLPAEFIHFLYKAKLATYAGQSDDASVVPALLDSKQLEYRDGEFFYRDIYVGMLRFVGQEIVYLSNQAVWSMCNAGGLINYNDPNLAKPIYRFLRQALLNVSPELPLRGPKTFKDCDMLYNCSCQGSLQAFNGIETIAQKSTLLYELHFSGGYLA